MPDSKPTYHSKIYRQFMEIEDQDFQQRIRFYEEHEAAIKKLDFEESFELLIIFVNALFETGAYEKHLIEVDIVIENSILRNIQYFNGEDIYRKMLFKKAASLYNLRRFKKADYVLKELIKIDPFDKDPILFLKKCLRKSKSNLIKITSALSIFMFLLTAAIIGVEILWIRTLHVEYTPFVETLRIGTFVIGILLLLAGNLFHRFRIEKEVRAFVDTIKKQKLGKK